MRTSLHQLMDTVDAAGFDSVDDFVADAHALFALALSKLPAAEREHVLFAIEGGLLRQDVMRFERPSPYPKLINGGLQ
jgi:hypothetical protein